MYCYVKQKKCSKAPYLFGYKIDSNHTDQNAYDLGPGNYLAINQKTDKEQCHSKDSAANQIPCIQVPAYFIHKYVSNFKTYNSHSQDKWSPVKLPVFVQNIITISLYVITD